MLTVGKIRAGMAFHPGYRLPGTKRERVRMLGNAVTPPAARDLIAAVAEAITGEPIEPCGCRIMRPRWWEATSARSVDLGSSPASCISIVVCAAG
jgi:hypothetical protein